MWSDGNTIQYTDDVLQNCIPETYIILLTNVTTVNSIKNKERFIGTEGGGVEGLAEKVGGIK